MASPRTNLAAPSIAPKKLDSSSSCLRRVRASFSSISPAERSASIAICLPGIASNEKRAATSAMRPEPLVITTKFTITRIANTIIPITKLPLVTKFPNASITWPAAAGPVWPFASISRVEARLSARRSMVAISSTVGKDEKSSGREMNSAVIRISTEKVIEMAREKSSSHRGIGRISTTRTVTNPSARMMSPRVRRKPAIASSGLAPPEAAGVPVVELAAWASAMGHAVHEDRRSGRDQIAARSTSPGEGTLTPSDEYCLSLLRNVRIEIPRMLAAWVRFPRQ